MDFETIKAIAAFGGLGLGVINLALVIYKDFFRKPVLEAEIESARICCRDVGIFDFQITFSVCARKGNVYLKEIELQHKENIFGPYNTVNKLVMNRVSPHLRYDLLALADEDYKTRVIELQEKSHFVRDLEITDGQRRSFTITDRFNSERCTNHWMEIPISGWNLTFDYGGKKSIVNFVFSPQGNNLNQFDRHA